MSKILAIKGHSTRGDEVIEILQMIGGEAIAAKGNDETAIYVIPVNGIIDVRFAYDKHIDEYAIFTLEEFLKKYPFKVGDKVNSPCKGCVKTITSMKWDDYLNTVSYKLDDKIYTTIEQLKVVNDLPCEEEVNMEDNKLFGTVSNPVETKSCTISLKDCEVIDNSIDSVQFVQSGKIVAVRFNAQNYENEVELQLDDYEIEIRDGKTYAVLKKSKYPKTYAECCDVLSIAPYYNLRYYTYEHGYNEYATTNELVALQGKLNILGKLIICCKAYWKIAGEQMGLDKPWDPKYGCGKWGYWIGYDINANKTYCQDSRLLLNRVLVFPTKEMRDVFYENFKELIEQCKELL